jgi:hypothetical protein
MKETDEITYDQAAGYLGYGPRHVRRVLQRNGVKPIRRGHRTVRFKAGTIFRLKFKLETENESRHQHTNGHGHTNGKGHR